MPTKPSAEDVDAMTDALLRASRLLVAVSAASIVAVDEVITFPQFRLLVVLQNLGEAKMATLAGSLGVNPSTATRTVDRLLHAGFVSREANPSSRREVVLALTEQGRAVVDKVTSTRRKEIAEIVEAMSPRNRRGLVEALASFAAAGGEPAISSLPPEIDLDPARRQGNASTTQSG
ncbi:MAG: MarR family winged helix-turn-helix transcriptional regulator [Sciscionella sp.]